MRIVAFGLAGLASLGALASAEAHQCYRLVTQPAQYRTVEEEVVVTPAREAIEYSPAVTRQVEETVTVAPEREITHVIPAKFGVEESTELVSPARREWRTRDEGGQEIGCWVNIPATYGRVAHRVVVEPAHEVTETIPEQTATECAWRSSSPRIRSPTRSPPPTRHASARNLSRRRAANGRRSIKPASAEIVAALVRQTRHCERKPKQSPAVGSALSGKASITPGLLRCARNDGLN